MVNVTIGLRILKILENFLKEMSNFVWSRENNSGCFRTSGSGGSHLSSQALESRGRLSLSLAKATLWNLVSKQSTPHPQNPHSPKERRVKRLYTSYFSHWNSGREGLFGSSIWVQSFVVAGDQSSWSHGVCSHAAEMSVDVPLTVIPTPGRMVLLTFRVNLPFPVEPRCPEVCSVAVMRHPDQSNLQKPTLDAGANTETLEGGWLAPGPLSLLFYRAVFSTTLMLRPLKQFFMYAVTPNHKIIFVATW